MIRVIGHRGAGDLAPENTLAGFILARDLGCHAIELDVHPTKDGQLAVIHDETIDRTTDGTGLVSSFTMRELRHFDAGDSETIPSLEEVLDLLRPTTLCFQVELKGEGSEHLATDIVRRKKMTPRVRFTSFLCRRVVEAKRLLPNAETGILVGEYPVDPIHLLKSAQANTFHAPHHLIDQSLVDKIHENGHSIVAMGKIVTTETIDTLAVLRVDEIGSDRPDLVINRLNYLGVYLPPS